MATQRQIRLHRGVICGGGLGVLAIQIAQAPELDHAVFGDGGHSIDTGNELDTPNDVHVRFEFILFAQLNILCISVSYRWGFISADIVGSVSFSL